MPEIIALMLTLSDFHGSRSVPVLVTVLLLVYSQAWCSSSSTRRRRRNLGGGEAVPEVAVATPREAHKEAKYFPSYVSSSVLKDFLRAEERQSR